MSTSCPSTMTKRELAHLIYSTVRYAAGLRRRGNAVAADLHLANARYLLAVLNRRIYQDRLSSAVMAFPKRITFHGVAAA